MTNALFHLCHTAPPQGLRHGPARVWLNVGVPQPSPDVVPLPHPTYPVPPRPALPPEITEPLLPGQNEPVREPTPPSTSPMNGWLH